MTPIRHASRARNVLLGCIASLPFVGIHADVLHLKNGSQLEGRVLERSDKPDGNTVIEIPGSGRIVLRSVDVLSIETSTPGTATTGRYVAVALTRGGGFYGNGTYYGRESAESNDSTLVLQIPDVGLLRIPRESIGSITEITTVPEHEEGARLAGSDESTIQTTHKVHLKNGRKVIGDLIETDESEPVRLRLGHIAVMTFQRHHVERVEQVDGIYRLPETSAQNVAVSDGSDAALPEAEGTQAESEAEFIERVKREVRAELLREIIDDVIDERLDTALQIGDGSPASLFEAQLSALTDEEIGELQFLADELSRQRNTNRVRAETRLKAAGSVALPFLTTAARHPFELTRRAVQRIVLEIGDVRGAALAIEALTDSDQFVREVAGKNVRTLLPQAGIDYHDNAPPTARLEAQRKLRAYWHEYLRNSAHASILGTIAGL